MNQHKNVSTEWTAQLLELGNEGFVRNGGRACDTAWGPCDCGAWHNSDEDKMRVEKAIALKAELATPKQKPSLRLVRS